MHSLLGAFTAIYIQQICKQHMHKLLVQTTYAQVAGLDITVYRGNLADFSMKQLGIFEINNS